MKQDLRQSALFKEAHSLLERLKKPGAGKVSDAVDLNISADGRSAFFAGVVVEVLEGLLPTRICQIDLASGELRILSDGPGTDRLPKIAPDGRTLAYLGDAERSGNYQLFLHDLEAASVTAAPETDGWIEYFHWSPDGKRLLLAVAGHGADVAGGQGAVTSKDNKGSDAAWLPSVSTGDESHHWRRLWIYDLGAGTVVPLGADDLNIWEAAWCGNDAVVAVASPGPSEGLWYTAKLIRLALDGTDRKELLTPRDQMGLPCADPAGQRVAIVEAICSDRWYVAGDLLVIDAGSGTVRLIDTAGTDITHLQWQSGRHLLVTGHRGFETVVGLYDADSGDYREIWASEDITVGGFYASTCALTSPGDFALVGESFTVAPEIALVEQGVYRQVRCLDPDYRAEVETISAVEKIRWNAPDDLEISGWLLRPKGAAPHPLVMLVHGGPVGHSRPRYMGRNVAYLLLLVQRGYAVFFPNPRGSGGHGQAFARKVYGDMGGGDAQDLLSGVAALVDRGIADPARLGVTGGSYGGFMTSWLVTQDQRFAAAVALAPHTNQMTERLIGNIAEFMDLLVGDQWTNLEGHYFSRSPIFYADQVTTPTLNVTGALDRCTPPEEAVQFHNALIENGVDSALVVYPDEGHGIRKYPAAIDYAARVVGWFETYMPA